MDKRREELTKLKSYTKEIDNELTMILQSLQWDRKHLLQNPEMVTCKYDSNHKVPPDKSEEHEKECFLKQNGYRKDDHFLPDPLNSESNTLVKLSKEDIEQIIENACRSNPLFKKGMGCCGAEPMSLERVQSSYSADERRAIHDAVVSAVPSCHDLTDLALLSVGDDQSSKVILTRTEILVQLRNMRRRRTKYRVAAKSRNYSDVLRDVIKTQMEHYNERQSENPPKENVDEQNDETDRQNDSRHSIQVSRDDDRYRYERHRKVVPRPIKIEREDTVERNKDYNRYKADRYKEGHRERDRDRDRYIERTRERNDERSQTYQEQSRKRRHENYEEDYQNNERRRESKERRKATDKEYIDEERRGHKHRDNDRMYQVKQEPGLDEDVNKHHKDRSSKRRHDAYKDREIHKHRDRTIESQQRDRGRSSEKRRDYRYDVRSSEIHIKQEREDSAIREGGSKKKKDKRHESTERRHDSSYRDRGYNSYSSDKKMKHENYNRYNDSTAEHVYDPNKIIKMEK